MSLSACYGLDDFDLDVRNEPKLTVASTNVDAYARRYYDFYQNLGFSKEAAKVMWIMYRLLYIDDNSFSEEPSKNKPVLEMRDGRLYIPGEGFADEFIGNISYREAKNIFACAILDGRAEVPYENRDEIEKYTKMFVDFLDTKDRYELVFSHLSREEIDKKLEQYVFEKFGIGAGNKISDKLSLLVGFSDLYNECAYFNDPADYLGREEVKELD